MRVIFLNQGAILQDIIKESYESYNHYIHIYYFPCWPNIYIYILTLWSEMSGDRSDLSGLRLGGDYGRLLLDDLWLIHGDVTIEHVVGLSYGWILLDIPHYILVNILLLLLS